MPAVEISVQLSPSAPINLNQLVTDFEFRLIEQALQVAGGIKSDAARILSLNRTTLLTKMSKHGFQLHAPFKRKRRSRRGAQC
jgi:sigma-54 specific flagellar transcriptional regulator A